MPLFTPYGYILENFINNVLLFTPAYVYSYIGITKTTNDEVYEMKPIKEGKVREIYDNGDSLIMVATDRLSCFDVISNSGLI